MTNIARHVHWCNGGMVAKGVNNPFLLRFTICSTSWYLHQALAFGWKYFLDDIMCELSLLLQSRHRSFLVYHLSPSMDFRSLNSTPISRLDPQCSLVSTVFSAGSQTFAWILLMLYQWMYYEIEKSLLWKVMDPNAGHCKRNTAVLWVFSFPLHFMNLIFMVWTSGFIVFAFYKHRESNVFTAPQSWVSPKVRVLRTILFLVNAFAAFYSVCSILVFGWYYLKSQVCRWWTSLCLWPLEQRKHFSVVGLNF